MRSGTKNILCEIKRNAEGAANARFNTPVYAGSTWKTAWANAQPRKAGEKDVLGQVQASSIMRFDFDYFDVDGIKAEDWISCDAGAFAIVAILPDINNKEYITVDAVIRPQGTGRA